MKTTLCLSLLLVSCAWAEEASDREGVAKTVSLLISGDRQPLLFTSDFQDAAEYGQVGSVPAVVISKEPFGEATIKFAPASSSPRFVILAVRFLTPEVAMVDAVDRQNDRGTVLLMMKKEGADWKVAAFRRVQAIEKTAP